MYNKQDDNENDSYLEHNVDYLEWIETHEYLFEEEDE